MCHNAGLMGGVFDNSFCIWPIGNDPHAGGRFSDNVYEFGEVINSDMNLDGGAGD